MPFDNPSTLNGLRILVVDDEIDVRILLTSVLEEEGAEVIAVASVREAMEIIRQVIPNLLMSDIGMPQEDGYTLIRELRLLEADQGGQIPAIALTAYAGEEDCQKAIAAGYDLHIPKPVDLEELLQTVIQIAVNPKTLKQ